MRQHRLSILALLLLLPLIVGALTNIPSAKAIAGFNIIISPTTQMVDDTVNQYAYYSIEVQSKDGFYGKVGLNATVSPSGPAITFPGGSVVNVPLDGSAFTYMLATVGATVPTYTFAYTITVNGLAQSESNTPGAIDSSTTTLVNQPHKPNDPRDFRLGSYPSNVINVAPGSSATLLIKIFSFTNNPTPQAVTLLLAPSIPGLITGSFTPSNVIVQSYSENVSILRVETTLATPSRNYTLVIRGSNDDGIIHTWAVTVRVSGFFVTAPTFVSVIQGKSATVSIGVQSIGTFSSAVTLNAINVPTGMTATFNPPSATPTPGGVATSILTIATLPSLAQGTYYLTITGTSGALTSSQALAVRVGEFSITATPSTRTAPQNTTTTYTVNGTSSADYSATMALSVAGLPSGVTASFIPSSILIPPAGTASSTLTLTIPLTATVGTYTLNITGTSGSQSHTTSVTLIIVAATDFSLTLNPTSITVRNGSSDRVTISVNSINNFNSPVALTVSIPAGSGATGSIVPSSVTPPAGGSATATLTITVAPTAPSGTGSVTVTGVGSKTRIAILSLTISPTAGRPCIIATATYGSELAPEVYFLRLFRDQSVQTTYAGGQFMNVFNAWYYSFSPTVAEQVRTNMALRNVAKATLYPLIGILNLAYWSYSAMSFAPEVAIVAAGLVASSLIGIVYIAPVALLVAELTRNKRLRLPSFNKPLAVAWAATLALIVFAEIASLPGLMMFATAALVLTTIAIATRITVTQTQRLFH